jgi:hypothetical protein
VTSLGNGYPTNRGTLSVHLENYLARSIPPISERPLGDRSIRQRVGCGNRDNQAVGFNELDKAREVCLIGTRKHRFYAWCGPSD